MRAKQLIENHRPLSAFALAAILCAGVVDQAIAQDPLKMAVAAEAAMRFTVGQSRTVNVSAGTSVGNTGIKLVSGETYQFIVSSPAWNNGNIVTDAGGYETTTPGINRFSEYKTMALVGEIEGKNKHFLIGLGRTWKASDSGFLLALANDCLSLYCYADNSRVVTLTVKRIQ